jgi:uncharacterized membrane protein YraQ (UPF0718 family)
VIVALLIATLSIAGGAALALLPQRSSHFLGPVRTFGLTASIAVVLLHLLPEVYAARGAVVLVAFVFALVVPHAVHPLMRALSKLNPTQGHAEWVTLRITYLSLLVHSVADGMALSAFSGHMHGAEPHYDVLVALSAHTVPVVAVMTLTFRDFRGLRFALYGALGLVLAASSGVALAQAIPTETVHGASAWVGAVVAGLLLHVVTHDLGGHAPKGQGGRAIDLAAAGAGVTVGLLSGDAHSHLTESQELGPTFGHALLDLGLETAPMLLIGLLAGALLQTFGSRIPSSWLRSRGAGRDALRGALLGLPLPLCSCSVLPISGALRRRRAAPALVVAFLLATPELGVETFALSVRFLGWPFAWARLAGAVLLAVTAAWIVGSLVGRSAESEVPAEGIVVAPAPTGGILSRLAGAFDELLYHIGAWMVLGVIAAAFVQALVPSGSMGGVSDPLLELGVMTLVTIPSYICAPSATPLAAVLLAKGISPGAVMVGLLLGPATNLATLVFLKSSYGLLRRSSVMVAFGASRGTASITSRPSTC